MKEQLFSIGGAIKEGWQLTKDNIGFLISYQAVIFIFVLLTMGEHHGFLGTVWGIVAWLILMLFKIGLYHSTLLIVDRVKPGFDQLYRNHEVLISWILASFLFALMLIVGLVLFIVPAFYVLATYGLFPFFIVDKKLGPIEALKAASKSVEGLRWQILLLFIACLGLNILGLLLLGIGLFVSVPVTLLSLAIVYRKLVVKVVEPEILS